MQADQKIVGEAVRVEYSEKDGKLYLVFEIIDEQYKQKIKADWTEDLEFTIINKSLVENE